MKCPYNVMLIQAINITDNNCIIIVLYSCFNRIEKPRSAAAEDQARATKQRALAQCPLISPLMSHLFHH